MSIIKEKITMVDLKGQYHKIKKDIDAAILDCIEAADFINGKAVNDFAIDLAGYTGAKFVIPCANGTDALQIALMTLGLKPGDEVIVPAFTYVATAEVIALLGLLPVLVDVQEDDFSINLEQVEKSIGPKTKAIVPVHLFGQCAGMEDLLKLADKHKLAVIEDAAQAIGAVYTFSDGSRKQAGTMGQMGTTSFFPSKNLGCYGDGGAVFTNDEALALKVKMIANHGQERKYYHDIIGVNSRLDTIQAAILAVKLKHLDTYCAARNSAADYYDKHLGVIDALIIPKRVPQSTHVFHQYTLKVKSGKRDALKKHLQDAGIPSMIYYPLPLHFQKAYQQEHYPSGTFPVAERLCGEVLSLPMHTELTAEMQDYIIETIQLFFN